MPPADNGSEDLGERDLLGNDDVLLGGLSSNSAGKDEPAADNGSTNLGEGDLLGNDDVLLGGLSSTSMAATLSASESSTVLAMEATEL